MQDIIDKAKRIRLFILDVDGVLTSGTIYYGTQGAEMKGFNILDGLGIKLLQRSGVVMGVISAKNSEPVARRLRELEIEHAYLGQNDKLPAYEDLKKKLNLTDDEIAYMGDDLPDLPILRRAGLAITVPNSSESMRQHVDITTVNAGGQGAVREVCEFIMKAQNTYESMLESYLV